MTKVLSDADFVSAVKDVVDRIFITEDKTTTKDIKESMRADGYYAVQADVADSMYVLWYVSGWEFTFNGLYRTYYPSIDAALKYVTLEKVVRGDFEEISPRLVEALEDKYLNDTLASIEPQIVSNPQPGDYIVSGVHADNHPVVFITGAENYVEAAVFYSNKFGIDYNLVRLKTIQS